MKYGIKELAELTGLTTRTLRYYDQIGLLKPARIGDNGYRFYNSEQLESLQQILFYRKRGFELKQIKDILSDPDYDVTRALHEHLLALEEQKNNIESLIQNIKITLLSMEGEYEMSEKERFEAFKEELVKENEAEYGTEVRENYGEQAIDESNEKILNMSEEQWNRFKALEAEIKIKLQEAVTEQMNPFGESGKEITAIHKEWLMMVWNSYTREAHKGLAQMYICDERFKSYYDSKVEGCSEFLQKAIEHWA